MTSPLKNRLRKVGALNLVTLGLLAAYLLLAWLAPGNGFTVLTLLALIVCGVWLAIRGMRVAVRRVIWGLRNRLLVTYLFIGLVPVLLIASLAALSAWFLAGQLTAYLVTSELDRRSTSLRYASEHLARENPAVWSDMMRGMSETFYAEQFPGIVFSGRRGNLTTAWPPKANLKQLPFGWKDHSGIVSLDGHPYLWSHVVRGDTEITAYAPITRRYLNQLSPGILISQAQGELASDRAASTGGNLRVTVGRKDYKVVEDEAGAEQAKLPAQANRFDISVFGVAQRPMALWTKPNQVDDILFYVRTRPSVLLGIVASEKLGELNGVIPYLILGIAILFLVVELVALVIGVSLTRTITRAVHDLYRGTQKVIEGNFSHRIRVFRNDQLGELTTSFNVMTGQVERLLVVAKEKERLQTELEIAREVQNQLYPRVVPAVRGLRLTATVKPARMVSGDYYDYVTLDPGRVAVSIGDVAGKGISAALLMATLQSSMRAHLRSATGAAMAVGGGATKFAVSTAHCVSELNQQLYAFTTAEKYATFCFGVYDDATSTFSYTNAGHLSPILIRGSTITELESNGMVVGAFPFAKYEESRIEMELGDLLVFYTDGITEPENAYGEMFGEERLIDLVVKNAHSDEAKIIETVMDAVEQWSGTAEQFDDMTILLARRI
jgi:sigma-B regulation protein RsbU (phosphoserine phosphatase)